MRIHTSQTDKVILIIISWYCSWLSKAECARTWRGNTRGRVAQGLEGRDISHLVLVQSSVGWTLAEYFCISHTWRKCFVCLAVIVCLVKIKSI